MRKFDVAFVLFDTTKFSTFECAKKWISEIKHHIESDGLKNIPVILLATKHDLLEDIKFNNNLDKFMTETCKSYDLKDWFIISSNNKTDAKKVMDKMLEILLDT